MARYKTVIVEGLIGSGKSSICKELATALGPTTLLLMEPDEQNAANPYLADFYGDRKRWALTMQIHLLGARYAMHEQAQWYVLRQDGDAVVDRSYFGDTAFARLQVLNGDMSEREYQTYTQLYHEMTAHVLHPNVCIRLLVSPETSAERISQRMSERAGRRCESTIDLQYLRDLDREITHMTDVLRHMGVLILDVPWDVERTSAVAREQSVRGLAARIREYNPPDFFLDLHRRTT
jgi:deoxyadenosine/deoxycytidine kinase